MSSAKPNRRDRERLRHRKEILEASCAVFADKGFKKTTIQDISKRSEFSIASIYKHFDSKEDIYHCIVEYILTLYHQSLKRSVSNIESPLEQLLACLDTTLDVFGENQAYSQFFLSELRTAVDKGTEQLAQKSVELYWKIINFYITIIQRAIEKKEIIDVRPEYLAVSLLGNIWGFMTYWLHFADRGFHLSDQDREIIPKLFFGPIALKPLPRRPKKT